MKYFVDYWQHIIKDPVITSILLTQSLLFAIIIKYYLKIKNLDKKMNALKEKSDKRQQEIEDLEDRISKLSNKIYDEL